MEKQIQGHSSKREFVYLVVLLTISFFLGKSQNSEIHPKHYICRKPLGALNNNIEVHVRGHMHQME